MARKNYPKRMKEILDDKNLSVLNAHITEETNDLIEVYQEAHQSVMKGHKLTKTEIVTYLIEEGKPRLEKDIRQFNKAQDAMNQIADF